MGTLDQLIIQIRLAFAETPFPGDTDLRNSGEGVEPYLLEGEFQGKRDWKTLDAAFIDLAPDGYASALNFFSAAAFRFYLPAYLLADLGGRLLHTNPVFHLTHGLTNGTKDSPINPLRYGEYTWFEYVSERFAGFSQAEVMAIIAYLNQKRETASTDFERGMIEEALDNYWLKRAVV